MTRKKIVKQMIKDLREKIPTRKDCCKATKSQISKILSKIDFQSMNDFLCENDLLLREEEIPNDLRNEFVLYLSKLDDCFYDKEIFDLQDDNTVLMIKRIRKYMDLSDDIEIPDIRLSDFLKYAKSDKPDF